MHRKPGTDTNFRRSLPEFGCLFECISMVLQSGSPEGYNAETGFCEPAQKPHVLKLRQVISLCHEGPIHAPAISSSMGKCLTVKLTEALLVLRIHYPRWHV